jgi:hypothetical protein
VQAADDLHPLRPAKDPRGNLAARLSQLLVRCPRRFVPREKAGARPDGAGATYRRSYGSVKNEKVLCTS